MFESLNTMEEPRKVPAEFKGILLPRGCVCMAMGGSIDPAHILAMIVDRESLLL